MYFNGVKIPDEIQIAMEEERLVIFAGAGVSMSSPSELPSFEGLASQIAGGGSVDDELPDRFLGKLARENHTDVHAAAAAFLFGDHTKPTPLHREILRLFGAGSKVRVVTTNFDDHFSAAARELFGKDHVREFCAPALPLGDNFTGLVYLHGSARLDYKNLVLTDRDFGAAYLSRGWARDFLVSLFSRYTVLFVGYSHRDVVTTYLARGIDPSQIGQRWAMVASEVPVKDRENWDHLEIKAIEYPIHPDNDENKHQALTDLFSQWADHTKESFFSRVKRVKAIARGLPPESNGDSAYLQYCFSDRQLANEFCRVTRHPAWLGWLHDRGYFDLFFDDTTPTARVVASHNVLACWLCSDVRRRYPDLLLDLIRRHNQRLSRNFSRTLAHLLWSDQRKESDRQFAVWLSVLLGQGKDATTEDIWSYLLHECRLPGHFGVALGVFELLTTPELRIDRGLDWSSVKQETDDSKHSATTKVDYSIQWPQQLSSGLREAWTEVFEPHIAEIAEPLARSVVQTLTRAHLLLKGAGKTSQHFDCLSESRSSIAPHEQDDIRRDDCLSCLIDILRSILNHWIETNPPRAHQRVEDWWSTKLPLLMRFAAYARAHDPQYGPDDRIRWVLAKDLVFRSGMKKEVFDIMASAYSKASLAVRRRLLRRVDRGYRGPGYKKLDCAILAYERFNVLAWLRRSDPDCPLVASAISKIYEDFPEFSEREHLEFDSWHGGVHWIDPTEGIDLDQINSRPPEQFATELLSADSKSVRSDLWSYLQCLPMLFKQNKEWGKGFVEVLARDMTADADIWNGVFSGWRDVIETETESDWEWILEIIDKLPHDRAIYEGVANLIAHGFPKVKDDWGEVTIDHAATLMDRSWELCKSENGTPDASYGDWMTTAINHVGGWIGDFWVHYCSHLHQRGGESWQSIPEPLRSRIIEAVRGSNRTKVHARIAVTPWIGYFFAWDRDFAIDHLLPLLDWRRDPITAQQSWSVLLSYDRGRFKKLEELLIPFYKQSAERFDQLDKESSRFLGLRLATLAIQVIPDPVESGFFREFLPLLPDEVRGSLALGIGNQIKHLDDDESSKLWSSWLKRYLDLRLVGIPVALSTVETKRMLEWCLHLEPVFEEAVERIVRMPQNSVEAFGILRDLEKSPALDKWPLAACRLAIAAIQAENYPIGNNSLETLHTKFKNTIGQTPEFKTYEELLFRRGWQK